MRDKAELLLEIDDIVVTLTVDIRMGFKRKKLSNVELADMDEDTRVHIKEILDGVNSSRDFNKVVDQLLNLEWTKVVTRNMNDQDKEILKTHLVRYLEAFQTENAEYKIEKTYRYAREGYQGAKIVAGKEVKKGAKISSLRGATARISLEQEKALGDRGVYACTEDLREGFTKKVAVLLDFVQITLNPTLRPLPQFGQLVPLLCTPMCQKIGQGSPTPSSPSPN